MYTLKKYYLELNFYAQMNKKQRNNFILCINEVIFKNRFAAVLMCCQGKHPHTA